MKPTKIEGLLIEFQAKLIQLETLKDIYGIDLSPMFREERRLLMRFGMLVMNVFVPPEHWKPSDIKKRLSPSWLDWSMLFSDWLKPERKITAQSYMYQIGVDTIELGSPYEDLLDGIFEQFYGFPALEETHCFAFDNQKNIYQYPDGQVKDLRSPARWATYFCERYERLSLPTLN
jgi:hypothetical protein